MSYLSPSQIDFFQKKGFLKVPGLLDEKVALKIQAEIWDELYAEFGIEKSNPESWKTPPHSPRNTKHSHTNKELINNNFRSVIDELIGAENWNEPSTWGGFLITFPDQNPDKWNLGNKLWHWDYELFRTPELGGLLILSFFSEVRPKGGGTLVVSGSHRVLAKYYRSLTPAQKNMKHGKQRKHFMSTHPYFVKLTASDITSADQIAEFMDNETSVDEVPLRVFELTGKPGDVVFCHPRIVHAPAGINLNNYPRFMRTKFLW